MNSIKQSNYFWFLTVNLILAILIASRYFDQLPVFPESPIAIVFLIASTLSQMAVLVILLGVCFLPIVFLKSSVRKGLLAFFTALALLVLLVDTIVFAQYRFHISWLMLQLVFSDQVATFSLFSWFLAIAGLSLIALLEWILLNWLEKQSFRKKLARPLGLALLTLWLISNSIHVWAAANSFSEVTRMKRYLPLFMPATANSLMRKMGWVDEEALERQKKMHLASNQDLNYPKNPVQTQTILQLVDIMLIVIDSWRADSFSLENTPNLWHFAQKGKTFANHWASGNATRTGIFGLFYGLPGTYWHAFLANNRSPVLIDRLQQLDYQMGIFAAASLANPEFNQTVFANLTDLRLKTEGKTPAQRDLRLTQDWTDWYQSRDPGKPAFSFLFFDSPHAYDFPKDFAVTYQPYLEEVNYLLLDKSSDPSLFLNRYKNSVSYVDQLIGQVFSELEKNDKQRPTLVIVTGDHGQEINDNRQNYWGHNSNFTSVQLRVPLIIRGPGFESELASWPATTLTSHLDLAPTLLTNYLAVSSPLTDYSLGEDLLAPPVNRDSLLVASYSKYAIVTEQTILEVGAAGQYEVLDKNNLPMPATPPDFGQIQKAFEQMSEFSLKKVTKK